MHPVFADDRFELDGIVLAPISPDSADVLATEFAAIDPWHQLGYSRERLVGYFTGGDGCSRRLQIEVEGHLAGVVAIRSPFLAGSYLEFLGIARSFQQAGIGIKILGWLERSAIEAGQRNIWVATSDFNEGAQRFYERFGFVETCRLDDLVAEGFSEILLRKKLGSADEGR